MTKSFAQKWVSPSDYCLAWIHMLYSHHFGSLSLPLLFIQAIGFLHWVIGVGWNINTGKHCANILAVCSCSHSQLTFLAISVTTCHSLYERASWLTILLHFLHNLLCLFIQKSYFWHFGGTFSAWVAQTTCTMKYNDFAINQVEWLHWKILMNESYGWICDSHT